MSSSANAEDGMDVSAPTTAAAAGGVSFPPQPYGMAPSPPAAAYPPPQAYPPSAPSAWTAASPSASSPASAPTSGGGFLSAIGSMFSQVGFCFFVSVGIGSLVTHSNLQPRYLLGESLYRDQDPHPRETAKPTLAEMRSD